VCWGGGRGPGMLTIGLSAAAGYTLFLRPHGAGAGAAPRIVPTALFVMVSGMIHLLTITLRRRYRERDELLQEARQAERDRNEALERERAARATAEEASSAKDAFLAMLGHELRNPLTPIVNSLQLIKARGVAGTRDLEIMERQARHLTRLVDDLLDIERITRGKVELSRVRVEVADVVARSIEMASPLVELKRHALHVEAPRGLVVLGDEHRLAQALGNIVINAAKYTDPSGTLRVSARREGDRISVSVKDSGMGIAPELLPRLFDAFVQGPRTRDRAQGGLGLGLALARTLVQLHGGTVTAHSDGPGKGSEIVITLPAAPADRGADERSPLPHDEAQANA
jgi:signal transduction histidine kinase